MERGEVEIRRENDAIFGMSLKVIKSKLVVEDISPNGPAAFSPLKVNDRIVSVNAVRIDVDVQQAMDIFKESTSVLLEYERDVQEAVVQPISVPMFMIGSETTEETVSYPTAKDLKVAVNPRIWHDDSDKDVRMTVVRPIIDFVSKKLIGNSSSAAVGKGERMSTRAIDLSLFLECRLYEQAESKIEFQDKKSIEARVIQEVRRIDSAMIEVAPTPLPVQSSSLSSSVANGTVKKVIEVINLISDDEDDMPQKPTSSSRGNIGNTTSSSPASTPLSVEELEEARSFREEIRSLWLTFAANFPLNEHLAGSKRKLPAVYEDDDDDEIEIMESAKKVKPNTLSSSSGTAAAEDAMEDDIEFLGGNFESTTSMPHAREACSKFQFKPNGATSNQVFCEFCYCYICDIKASECEMWMNNHCQATFRSPLNKKEREICSSHVFKGMPKKAASDFWTVYNNDVMSLSRMHGRGAMDLMCGKFLRRIKDILASVASTPSTGTLLAEAALLLVCLMKTSAEISPDVKSKVHTSVMNVFCSTHLSAVTRLGFTKELETTRSVFGGSKGFPVEMLRLLCDHNAENPLEDLPADFHTKLSKDGSNLLADKLRISGRLEEARVFERQQATQPKGQSAPPKVVGPTSQILAEIRATNFGSALALLEKLSEFELLSFTCAIDRDWRNLKDLVFLMGVLFTFKRLGNHEPSIDTLVPRTNYLLQLCFNLLARVFDWSGLQWMAPDIAVVRTFLEEPVTFNAFIRLQSFKDSPATLIKLAVGIACSINQFFSTPAICEVFLGEAQKALTGSLFPFTHIPAIASYLKILSSDSTPQYSVYALNIYVAYLKRAHALNTNFPFSTELFECLIVKNEACLLFHNDTSLNDLLFSLCGRYLNCFPSFYRHDFVQYTVDFRQNTQATTDANILISKWLWTVFIYRYNAYCSQTNQSVGDIMYQFLGSFHDLTHLQKLQSSYFSFELSCLHDLAHIASMFRVSGRGYLECILPHVQTFLTKIADNPLTKNNSMWLLLLQHIPHLSFIGLLSCGKCPTVDQISGPLLDGLFRELSEWRTYKRYVNITPEMAKKLAVFFAAVCAHSDKSFMSLRYELESRYNIVDNIAQADVASAVTVAFTVLSVPLVGRLLCNKTDADLAQYRGLLQSRVETLLSGPVVSYEIFHDALFFATGMKMPDIASLILDSDKVPLRDAVRDAFNYTKSVEALQVLLTERLLRNIRTSILSDKGTNLQLNSNTLCLKLKLQVGDLVNSLAVCEFLCYANSERASFAAFLEAVSRDSVARTGGTTDNDEIARTRRGELLDWLRLAVKSQKLDVSIFLQSVSLFPECDHNQEIVGLMGILEARKTCAFECLGQFCRLAESFPLYSHYFLERILSILTSDKTKYLTNTHLVDLSFLIANPERTVDYICEEVPTGAGTGAGTGMSRCCTLFSILLLSNNPAAEISQEQQIEWVKTIQSKVTSEVVFTSMTHLCMYKLCAEGQFTALFDILDMCSHSIVRAGELMEAASLTTPSVFAPPNELRLVVSTTAQWMLQLQNIKGQDVFQAALPDNFSTNSQQLIYNLANDALMCEDEKLSRIVNVSFIKAMLSAAVDLFPALDQAAKILDPSSEEFADARYVEWLSLLRTFIHEDIPSSLGTPKLKVSYFRRLIEHQYVPYHGANTSKQHRIVFDSSALVTCLSTGLIVYTAPKVFVPLDNIFTAWDEAQVNEIVQNLCSIVNNNTDGRMNNIDAKLAVGEPLVTVLRAVLLSTQAITKALPYIPLLRPLIVALAPICPCNDLVCLYALHADHVIDIGGLLPLLSEHSQALYKLCYRKIDKGVVSAADIVKFMSVPMPADLSEPLQRHYTGLRNQLGNMMVEHYKAGFYSAIGTAPDILIFKDFVLGVNPKAALSNASHLEVAWTFLAGSDSENARAIFNIAVLVTDSILACKSVTAQMRGIYITFMEIMKKVLTQGDVEDRDLWVLLRAHALRKLERKKTIVPLLTSL